MDILCTVGSALGGKGTSELRILIYILQKGGASKRAEAMLS